MISAKPRRLTLRQYTDVGWSKRSALKDYAISLVPTIYRLDLPSALASTLGGGNSAANRKIYISGRIKYLTGRGNWLRGEFDGVSSRS